MPFSPLVPGAARPRYAARTLGSPPMSAGGRFLYWRHSSGASLGSGNAKIDYTMLRDGTMTAVYEGRRLGSRPREPRDGTAKDQ